MPKQLNVNLAFTADTSQAKKQIQDLFDSLNKVQIKTPSIMDDVQLKKAAQAAQELQHHLSAALDVDTGKLDLSKFSQSLNKSGKDLNYYRRELTAIGPEGQQAFIKVAQSVLASEKSLSAAQKMANSFLVTLKNTARWQISSSILHGLQGAIQSAFYYAQDLDKSLNNIQIVTGQNADQMARFAEEANAAAKALSTTTTTYTDAALIYYQQGLSDEEVKARTDVTVKLANVTGDSASKVSEQMTAIWNNFDDGAQNLEHYADVLTALGAATASSSDEIAGGMQQFAASASTVGLSYEYAASALATVVASTRQSENVVGNAFKTLFARLEGLNLGETLDDGTTLNKYSAALDKVGISIKDQYGNMKAMDDILDELGAKWGTLAKDQQVALAQTVGGVRQYTQLIALMNDWDEFQKNLSIANKSDGSLQEQADIYATSWDAAKEHVQASLEDIYSTLIDREFFTDLYNLFAKLLEGVNGLVKGLGGVPGILMMIGSIGTQIFAKNMPQAMDRLSNKFLTTAQTGEKTLIDLKAMIDDEIAHTDIDTNPEQVVELTTIKALTELKQDLINKQDRMTEAEKNTYAEQMNQIQVLGQIAKIKAKTVQDEEAHSKIIAKRVAQQLQARWNNSKDNKGQVVSKTDENDIAAQVLEFRRLTQNLETVNKLQSEVTEQNDRWKQKGVQNAEAMADAIEKMLNKWDNADVNNLTIMKNGENLGLKQLKDMFDQFKEGSISIEEMKAAFDSFANNPELKIGVSNKINQIEDDLNKTKIALKEMGASDKDLNELTKTFEKMANEGEDVAKITDTINQKVKDIKESLGHKGGLSEDITLTVSALMGAASSIQSIRGAVQNLADDSTSGFDKAASAVTAFGSTILQTARLQKMLAESSNATLASLSGWVAPLMIIISLATTIYSIYEQNQAKIQELREEEAQAAQERVDTLKEEVAAGNETLENYKSLLKTYEETGEGKDQLDQVGQELLKQYDRENQKILLLQENYAGLIDVIANADKAKRNLLHGEVEGAIDSLLIAKQDEFTKGAFDFTKTDGTTIFNNIGRASVTDSDEKNNLNNNLRQAINSSELSHLEAKFNAGGYNFGINFENSAQGIIDAYDEVNKVLSLARDNAETSEERQALLADKTYQRLTEWANRYKDIVTQFKSLMETKEGLEIEEFADQWAQKNGDITTLEQYQELFQALSREGKFTADNIKTFLQGTYSEFAQLETNFAEASKQSKGLTSKQIQSWYNSLNGSEEEKLAIFAKIKFDAASSVAELNEQKELIQAEADRNAIRLKIDTYTEAKNSLTENMSREDWLQFKETSGIEWGKVNENGEEEIVQFNEFLRMSYDEQVAYIDGLIAKQEAASRIASQNYINSQEEIKNSIDSLESEKNDLKKQLNEENLRLLSADGAVERAEIQETISSLEASLELIDSKIQDKRGQLDDILTEQELLQIDMNSKAVNAESFEELNQMLQEGSINVEAFNLGLEEFYEKLDDDIETEALEDMSKYLEKNAKDVEGLSEQLLVDKKSAEATAKAILRYDSAVQKVTDHYDEWIEALDSGNEYEQAEALKEVRDNFNDILDMPFDSLSDDFVSNRENLELMKEAAEGDEQAYNDLLEAANKDILTTVGLNDADFQSKYNDIKSKVDAGLQDIEAGAYIDDSQAIQAMNELINAAAMTADQATDLLASMGVDAEVEQVDIPADSKYAGADATITYDYAESPNLLVGGTDTTSIPVPNITYTATPEVVPGEMTATAFRVKSARKSSGGGIKKSLSPSGGGGGSKGGGGGGGGSVPKHQTVDRAAKKPTQKVEDRYHVINNQIEDLAKQYDRLSEAEERAFGKSKLALMDRQVEILKDQYEAQRKLRKEAEKYWAEDLANLKSASYDADGDGEVDTLGIEEYLKDNPISLKLDENGTILNYDELIDAANNRYNSFIAQYNAFIDGYNSLTAEQQESEKEKFEAEKEQWDKRLKDEDKYYENFLGLITQYEETQDKVQEEFNKEIEQYHEMLDKLLEKTEYQVKLRLDIDDDALKVIDFLMKTVADDAFDAAQKIDLIGQQTALTLDKIKAETEGISGIFSNHFGEDHVFDTTSADLTENNFVKAMQAAGYTKAVNGDETKLQLDTDKLINDLQTGKTSLQNILGSMKDEFTDEEIEKFREHVSNLLDDTADLWQQRKDLFEAASEQIEASNDRLEKMADQIDHLNEVTGKYKDIMDILGHNGYYGITTKQITELAGAQHQMYVDSVAAAKARNDFAQNTLKTLQEEQKAYAEGTDMYNYYQGLIDEAQETANQTEQELMSDLEEALQHVRDTFDETMELMAADASKILGGAMGSLEGLSNIMDQYEKTHDTFVDGYEQVYRLNKLNAEAAKAIDETNNPKAKKELMKYQQEVLDQMRAYQEDGAQVSEWELQNLEKKLALRQAELALEEARNVKSQVRMQRDNEGNYSYVYTADEDNVADAEANYRDKLYEMQKANAEYIQQLQNDIVSLQQDALQQIAHAQETYGYGTEAYFKAVNQIETWYNEAVQDKYNQLELVMGANQDLQQFDLEFHSRITGDMMLKDQDYVTNFEQTVLSQQTGFATSQQAASVWNEALTGLIKGVEEETNLYKERNEEAMNAAGQTLEQNKENYKKWGETAHEQSSQAIEDSGELKNKIEEYAKTFDEQINGKEGVLADIKTWADAWSKIVDEMVKKNEGLANSMGEVIKKLSGIGEEIQKVKDAQPMKITVEQENTGVNDGTTAASVPVSVGGNGSSGGGAGGTGSTGGYEPSTPKVEEPKKIDENPLWKKSPTFHWQTYTDGTLVPGTKATHTHGESRSNSVLWECPICHYAQEIPKPTMGSNPTNQGSTSNRFNRITTGATGMYTGDWGSSEGKLAILHEKELVLNKEDTANMLAAVGMIRQISSVIDLNAKTAGGAFSQLIAAGVSTGAQELQQEVHITAEFPNATDKNEILEAFDNVINLASMYANRKV